MYLTLCSVCNFRISILPSFSKKVAVVVDEEAEERYGTAFEALMKKVAGQIRNPTVLSIKENIKKITMYRKHENDRKKGNQSKMC